MRIRATIFLSHHTSENLDDDDDDRPYTRKVLGIDHFSKRFRHSIAQQVLVEGETELATGLFI